MLRINVDEDEVAVIAWAQEELGETPEKVSLWDIVGERIECMIRLSASVVVAVLVGDGEIKIDEQRLTIAAENWTPGSVQANRRPDGCIRVRYRRRRIDITAEIKSPHSVASLLEGWLLEMRGEAQLPRDQNRRIANLKRERESIRRMLEQGSLERIQEEVDKVKEKITNAEIELSGRLSMKSKAEPESES
jgi:hypothetical protein